MLQKIWAGFVNKAVGMKCVSHLINFLLLSYLRHSTGDEVTTTTRYRVVVATSWVRGCEWPCLRLYQQFRESCLHLLYFGETE